MRPGRRRARDGRGRARPRDGGLPRGRGGPRPRSVPPTSGLELEALLVPKDPNDGKDLIVEIRAGAGGQEAALWAGELFEMYRRLAERHRWKTEVLSSSPSDLGGFKEAVIEVRGRDAYGRLKHESGVHRVQRVPVTESSGRIHTSTATVAVLPEAEEVEVEIRPEDLVIDVYRSSGPGRAVGEHHRLRGAHRAPADRHQDRVPGRALPAAEPREGHAVPARAAAAARPGRGCCQGGRGAPVAARVGRSLREDPHLQLPRRTGHRPPHQAHLAPARGRAGRGRGARRLRRPPQRGGTVPTSSPTATRSRDEPRDRSCGAPPPTSSATVSTRRSRRPSSCSRRSSRPIGPGSTRAPSPARRRGEGRSDACSADGATGTPTQHLTGETGFRHLTVTVRAGRLRAPARDRGRRRRRARGRARRRGARRRRRRHGHRRHRPVDQAGASRRARCGRPTARAEAIELARENASRNGLEIELVQGDMLDGRSPIARRHPSTWSSPTLPTSSLRRTRLLPVEVRADPVEALVGGVPVYERLFDQAGRVLRAGGSVVVEIGEDQAEAVAALATRAGASRRLGRTRPHGSRSGRGGPSGREPRPDRRRGACGARRRARGVPDRHRLRARGTRPDDARGHPGASSGRSGAMPRPDAAGARPDRAGGRARDRSASTSGPRRIAAAFWPGALTLVLPRTPASRAWDLGGDDEHDRGARARITRSRARCSTARVRSR